MNARVVVIQHVEYEGPGLLAELLARAGLAIELVHAWRGDPIPRDLDGARALIVLGGPMGVYEADRYPHLVDELALIRRVHAAGAPLLGICLGSQLVASALGAEVSASGRLEIAWQPVALAPAAVDDPLFAGIAAPFAPMHWHGDVFDLPVGAIPLASSAMTPLQAFRAGARTWALLFHLEVTQAWVEGCATAFADELHAHGVDPAALIAAAPSALAAIDPIARTVLGRFVALI